MTCFSKNIKYLRTKYGLDQVKLADKLGKKGGTSVANWERGTAVPPVGVLSDISEIFAVSIDDLMKEDLSQPTPTTLTQITDTSAKLEEQRQITVLNVATKELQQQQQQQQQLNSLEEYRKRKSEKQAMGKISWLGCASAGTGEFLTDSVDEEIELPISMIPDCADFCLSVNGNSMEPIFHNDDYIFIEKQLELFSGAIGVVIVNNEAFLKRIWFENNHARLESFNKDYEDIIVTEDDEFKIIGKVVM